MVSFAEFTSRLGAARIVPILRLATASDSQTAARWLMDAGFSIIELTMTTPGALALVKSLKTNGLDAAQAPLIGVGTILSVGDAVAAISAGADFLVTPCWVDAVAELGTQYGKPTIIGAATPSEILAARAARATIVKVFPAASLGGPAYIRSVRAVFPDTPLMPTGGVTPEAARDYLNAGAIAVGLGSELAPPALVATGDKAAVLSRIAAVRATIGER